MEIQFKKTYAPARGKRYVLGEIPLMLGYAMEIADPRAKMQEGKLNPGEICMMLFGVTPEEHAWKDQNPKALDRLADQLLKHVPADRLLGWRIIDLKGTALQRDVKPKTGESIDGGEFARRVQRQAAQSGPMDAQLLQLRALQQQCAGKDAPEEIKTKLQEARQAFAEPFMALEKLYAAYDAPTGLRWPAVGYDGRVELFTTEERAVRACEQLNRPLAGVKVWEMRPLQGEERAKLISECAENGLDLLRVDNGFAAAELNIKDICKDAPKPNAALRGMMIREVQYGMRWNQLRDAKADEPVVRGALESMLSMRNFVWREIGNAKLFVLCLGGQRDKCVMFNSQKQPEKMLAVFTNQARAMRFAHQVKEAVLPVEMNFDALKHACAACDGMVVDMGFIAYRLLKKDFDQVIELRGKPPVAVRVKPPEQARAPRPAQDLGELPDPDAFAPKQEDMPEDQKEAAPAAEEEAAQPAAQTGFLKRLFGKRKN